MRSPTLLCAALPIGFGPAAKLLAIARELQNADLRLQVVGDGSAGELLALGGELPPQVEVLNPAAEELEKLVRQSTAVLSLMDRQIAALAQRCERPLFVVDSLLWMRDRVAPGFVGAERYWVQRFADVRAVADCDTVAIQSVGPIVSPEVIPAEERTGGVVINLGGCRSQAVEENLLWGYAAQIVQAVLEAGVAGDGSIGATVLCGQRCANYLRERFGACGLEFATREHATTVRLLASAAAVVTSPGLTATLESFQHGVPTLFLPPQNYSQWCVLGELRRRGLAEDAVSWEAASQERSLRLGMAECERQPLVERSLQAFMASDAARQSLAQYLRCWEPAELETLGAKQHAFFRSLGENGARDIATQLTTLLLGGHETQRAATCAGVEG